MQRKLSMIKIAELLRLKYECGCGHRQIAASLHISASTVSDYIRRLAAASITWPLPESLTEEVLYAQLFGVQSPTPITGVLPDWNTLHQELRRKGVTLQLLWQEHRVQQPQAMSYSQFCRRYRERQQEVEPVMRFVHRAGENCFVDYAGQTVPWVDTRTGETHQAQVFVGAIESVGFFMPPFFPSIYPIVH